MRTLAALAIALSVSACVTASPTDYKLKPEFAGECTKHCNTLDMRLGAIVVIKNAAGCVCEPRERAGEAPRAAAGAAAAGAAIAVEEEEARRNQQQQSTPQPHRPGSFR